MRSYLQKFGSSASGSSGSKPLQQCRRSVKYHRVFFRAFTAPNRAAGVGHLHQAGVNPTSDPVVPAAARGTASCCRSIDGRGAAGSPAGRALDQQARSRPRAGAGAGGRAAARTPNRRGAACAGTTPRTRRHSDTEHRAIAGRRSVVGDLDPVVEPVLERQLQHRRRICRGAGTPPPGSSWRPGCAGGITIVSCRLRARADGKKQPSATLAYLIHLD
jgi:hypothetical protein